MCLKLLEIVERTRDELAKDKFESVIYAIEKELELFTEEELIQNSKINIIYTTCRDFVIKAADSNTWTLIDHLSLQALCKFSCVSQNLCKSNLDLIFYLVNSQAPSTVKQTIIITIGDLYKRFTNLI